jgi:hypothetical protein
MLATLRETTGSWEGMERWQTRLIQDDADLENVAAWSLEESPRRPARQSSASHTAGTYVPLSQRNGSDEPNTLS